MTGPARIPESQQLRHFVIRLARRVVSRPSDQLVAARLGHEVQARVAAGNDQHRGGHRQLAVLEHERLDVAREVMDADDWPLERRGRGLRERHADEERPDESRALRDRQRVDVGQPQPASASARSTTPQMSRTCWRDAISGTTPPHSR